MKRISAVLAVAAAALAFAGQASAVDFGATEDEGKLAPGFVYNEMQALGMKVNVMSVTWNPSTPAAFPPDWPLVKTAVREAAERGIEITLATYQGRARGITETTNAPAVFASWVAALARDCPACTKIVVLNEPNQPRFFGPIFDLACNPSSPAAYAEVLAASYDALKAVNPFIRVYGMGLSPRGNDNCSAASNVSLSPTTFISALGKAYRAMGRSKPLMDAVSFHPYPNVNTDSPSKGYGWPNIGVPNLDRLKQAVYDAFDGTAQPTFSEGLKVAIDEVGWQVGTEGVAGYTGAENVPAVDEATQAKYYAEVIEILSCDPIVESVSFFHLVDEADRDRFQSGVLRVDHSRRPSFDSVKAAIAKAGSCQGKAETPAAPVTKTVLGAKVDFGKLGVSPSKRTFWSFRATAQETTKYVAGIFKVGGASVKAKERTAILRGLAAVRAPKAVAKVQGTIKANYNVLVKAPKKRLARGTYVYAIKLAAVSNPDRTNTFVSKPFRVVNQ
jgi:hypothetical protein